MHLHEYKIVVFGYLIRWVSKYVIKMSVLKKGFCKLVEGYKKIANEEKIAKESKEV